MEKLKNGKSGKIINRFKSKKTLLQFKPAECIINLLRTLGILYCLKLTGRYSVRT